MDPYLDPMDEAFAKASAEVPPPQDLGYTDARSALEDLQRHEIGPDVVIEKYDMCFEGVTAPMTIFRPKTKSGPCPFVFYMHGGGWILGR